MTEKWILIVDDEESILSVLQKSLNKLGDQYRVMVASNGSSAMTMLRKNPFDLVVTDYKMAGMDGLNLLEAIHAIQPACRVILMTAYGSEYIEAEARRLQAYRYLSKPLEIDAFREIVKEALDGVAVSQPGILILSEDRYKKMNQLLLKLGGEIGARCIFLTNTEGHLIARTGYTEKFPLEQVVCLVGGSITTLLEVGRFLDGDYDSINLAFHEGKNEYFYVINIGPQLLLIIILERGPFSSRLGSVWYAARQTAQQLKELIGETDLTKQFQILPNAAEDAFSAEIDHLLADSFGSTTE
jgi:CheY-like chemotaxis protein